MSVEQSKEHHPARTALKYGPIVASTRSDHGPLPPVAFDCVRLIFVRAGSAIAFREFGTQHVNLGDVVVLAPHTLCGAEPEGRITTTTVYIDPDYLADVTFWKYVQYVCDRLDAKQFFETRHSEPAQVLHLGEERVDLLAAWLDPLARLSTEKPGPEGFLQAQSLVSAILDVIVPHLRTTELQLTASQRWTTYPSLPRHRPFSALRREAHRSAAVMRADIAHRWTLAELAAEVHLSPSQLGRVFTAAFGKSPIAYLTMLRVEKMVSLLRTTDASVSVISEKVGWQDADFATRQFRRAVGTTPSQYRAMIGPHVEEERPGRSVHRSC